MARRHGLQWLGLLLLVLPVLHGKSGIYSNKFNKTCRYAAYNISASLFQSGQEGGFAFIAPLESSMVVNQYSKPWQACFGPGEDVNIQLMNNGRKLPCFYKINKWGNYDYWEEHACDILLRSNCYCYAVHRYEGSYCEPGLGTTGKSFPLPIRDCYNAVQGVLMDGGRMVDRWTVYNRPPVTIADTFHYIAMAVKTSSGSGDTGDFHFWKWDHRDGTWSYKAGDTLSRNTYRNGTALRDLDVPGARGAYNTFCGYFAVWPDSHRLKVGATTGHRLKGNGYYFSNLPSRYKQWHDLGIYSRVTTLSRISPGWLAAYRSYFADAGWEDGPFHYPHKEAGRLDELPYHPHTYSVRPLDFNGTLPEASPIRKSVNNGSMALNNSLVSNGFMSTDFLTNISLTKGPPADGANGSLTEGALTSGVLGNRSRTTSESTSKSPLAVSSLANGSSTNGSLTNGSLADVSTANDSTPLTISDPQPVSSTSSLAVTGNTSA